MRRERTKKIGIYPKTFDHHCSIGTPNLQSSSQKIESLTPTPPCIHLKLIKINPCEWPLSQVTVVYQTLFKLVQR